MEWFLISLLALLVGPLLYPLLVRSRSMEHALHGFITVTISGILVLHILPETFNQAGFWIVPAFLLGLFGPAFSEKILHHQVHTTHKFAIILGVLGLIFHAMFDGAALVDPHHHGHHVGHDHHTGFFLAIAVILHRIPVGLALWWLIRPNLGLRVAVSLFGLLYFGTAIGFFWGHATLLQWDHTAIALFQAVVAGSLLHVVFHRPHHDGADHHHHQKVPGWTESLGNLTGLGFLVVLGMDHHADGFLPGFLQRFLALFLESAPALLLGYAAAGLAFALFGNRFIPWLKQGNPAIQAGKGILVGLPLPICSCGVVPMFHKLVRQGAPVAAAFAFFVATPELGFDALFLSIPFLGVPFSLIRVLAAVLVAFALALLFSRVKPAKDPEPPDPESPVPDIKSRLRQGLREGFVSLVDHTAPWILIGLAIAALAEPLLRPEWLGSVHPALQVPLLALIGLPVYVCASGATPLVALLMAKGIAPGAALAFLITGPATNVTTFGILKTLFNQKVALWFGCSALILAVFTGWIINGLDLPPVPEFPLQLTSTVPSWRFGAAIVLGLLMFSRFFQRGMRDFFGRLF
jgi:hypothetical protein